MMRNGFMKLKFLYSTICCIFRGRSVVCIFANRKERHRQSRAWTTHTSFRIYTVEHRANRSSSNPTPDPINGFLVEPRTCSAMNVTTVVIERNCIIREGESSLIAEADSSSSDGKGMIRDGVFRFGSSSFIYLLYICPISFFFS